MFGRVWQLLKRELSVALKTFLRAWLVLTVALQLYCLYASPKLHGATEVMLMLTVGLLICAFYTLWPALGVALVRSVYRIAGWGAFVGALLIASGALISLLLFRNVIASFLIEIFTSATFFGQCGGHAGGPASAVPALICLVIAIVGSPASWWALVKLFLVVSGAILLGSVPGLLLWFALLVRKAAKLVASASNSR